MQKKHQYFNEENQYDQQNMPRQMPQNPHYQQIQLNPYQYPTKLICPVCRLQVQSTVIEKPGDSVVIWSAVSCCICCCYCLIPACFIPFLWTKCHDKNHYCSNCGFKILIKNQKFFAICQ